LFGGLTAEADARFATAGTEFLCLGQVMAELATFEVIGQDGAAMGVSSLGLSFLGQVAVSAVRNGVRSDASAAASSFGLQSAFSVRRRATSVSSSRTMPCKVAVVGQGSVWGKQGGVHATFKHATADR